MNLTLKQVDQRTLNSASASWKQELDDLGEDVIPIHGYMIHLGYLQNQVSTKPNGMVYYALTNEDNKVEAIFEMSVVLPNSLESYLKILSVRTAPHNDTRIPEKTADDFILKKQKLNNIYTQVIIEGIKFAQNEYPANMVKMYGNKQADENFFAMIINTAWHNIFFKKMGLEFNKQGNWLRIDITK